VASVEARDLEEYLASMDASIGDLVEGSEAEAIAGKTWDFGESVVMEKTSRRWKGRGTFLLGGRASAGGADRAFSCRGLCHGVQGLLLMRPLPSLRYIFA
jgi:hypothetical protein